MANQMSRTEAYFHFPLHTVLESSFFLTWFVQLVPSFFPPSQLISRMNLFYLVTLSFSYLPSEAYPEADLNSCLDYELGGL